MLGLGQPRLLEEPDVERGRPRPLFGPLQELASCCPGITIVGDCFENRVFLLLSCRVLEFRGFPPMVGTALLRGRRPRRTMRAIGASCMATNMPARGASGSHVWLVPSWAQRRGGG
eukprot:2284914-Pyramimonas_sp.AAC.1